MQEYEKIYFDEFQHSILDLGEKITITNLSEKYERPINEISSALTKWTEIEKDKKLKKEYILRGIHKDGFPLITIVSGDKLEKAKESVKNAYAYLYSAEVLSSSPTLNINRLSTLKSKTLIYPESVLQRKNVEPKQVSKQGESSTVVKVEPTIQASKKSANDYFKTPNSSDSLKRKFENVTKPEISPKKEKTSPETKHDIKPVLNKKTSPVKGKTATGKGSIASFFSAKSAAKTEQKLTNGGGNESRQEKPADKFSNNVQNPIQKPNKNEDIKKIDKTTASGTSNPSHETKTIKKNSFETNNISKKRPLEDSGSKKQEQNPKKQKKISAGRRRIIVDSSDEENVAEDSEPEHETKREPEPESKPESEAETEIKIIENSVEVVEVEEESESVESAPLTPLTYQDEDGFLVTIKEKKPPPKKVTRPATVKKTPVKVEKVPVKTATKQGSIRNFFMKK